MSFAFVPVYIHFLGIEAYGLIGFFVSFQVLLALLDMGLGAAINRELARMSIEAGNETEMRHLLRTLEWLYWTAAVFIALITWLLAPVLATHWLQSVHLSVPQVQRDIVLMGAAFAARWPFALYSGALMGLQRQVLLNAIKTGVETLRSGGAAVVLWLIAPTLESFLVWQLAMGLAGSLLTAYAAWLSLPESEAPARFQRAQLIRIWRFAAGMTGISVTVVVLTQADKIVLSKILSLEDFGYYTLAWAVAAGLTQLVTPIVSAFSPRLAQVVAQNDAAAIRQTYHLGAQWLAAIVLPVGMTLAVFAQDVLLLWTHSTAIAVRSHAVMSILLVGTCLNALMNMPYALQLAYGWTRLALLTNLAAVAVMVPMVILATQRYGAVGAASVWVFLNLGYLLIPLQIMHTRLLPREKGTWYLYDAFLPLLLSFAGAVVMRAILPDGLGWMAMIGMLVGTVLLVSFLSLMAMPNTRQLVMLRLGVSASFRP